MAWEGGDGRGHIVALKAMAQALRHDYVFDAALCRMRYAGELAPLCETVMQGGVLGYATARRQAAGNPGTATWGEFLGDVGFLDADVLARQIAWWQYVIRQRKIALVIADFAPCAMLAARGLGIATVATGVGYDIPPQDLQEYPILLPEYGKRLHEEGDMVAAVNRAAVPLGVAPLQRLPQVWTCDTQIVCTLPMLDPYAAARTEGHLPPTADFATQLASGGEEVFVYFSTTETANAALVDAICGLGVPTRAFMPAIEPAMARRLAECRVSVETTPVPVDDLVARSRMIVHAGQHGIICLGLAGGLPQVAFPQNIEQLYHARCAETAGVLALPPRPWMEPDKIIAAIRAVYGDAAMAARAQVLARTVRPALQLDAAALIRERVQAIGA